MIAAAILAEVLIIVAGVYLCVQDWIKCQYRDAALWYYQQHQDDQAEADEQLKLIKLIHREAMDRVDELRRVRGEVSRPRAKLRLQGVH